MRDTTIAKNYAEALLELAKKAGEAEGWGVLIHDMASAIEANPELRLFLGSPRISGAEKSEVLAKAMQDRMPAMFVRFLQWLVKNRRQMLIPEIDIEYQSLLDQVEGRVHAMVTVARPTDEAGAQWISEQLSRVIGKKVIAHVTVNEAILGGVIARVGDTVMDGSVRRRIASLRSRLL